MLETDGPMSAVLDPLSVANGSIAGSASAAPSAIVAMIGISMKPKVTSMAIPTVAFGLCRMVFRAPPNMSPSVSGRSGTTPGWWTGGPQWGGGCWGPGPPYDVAQGCWYPGAGGGYADPGGGNCWPGGVGPFGGSPPVPEGGTLVIGSPGISLDVWRAAGPQPSCQ